MRKITSIFLTIFLVSMSFSFLDAQDDIEWLQEFQEEMMIGDDSYQYLFNRVEGNDCKIRITEKVTDKKGRLSTREWEFYLSDIDPNALRFNTSGKSITIEMQTKQEQEFILAYEDGEFEEYTEELELNLSEVDKTRTFIDKMKEQIPECKENTRAWESADDAFEWLIQNIGEAREDDILHQQKFMKGVKDHMAEIEILSTDDDGDQEKFHYIFDLSDINPNAIDLDISGRSLSAVVQVKGGERYIQVRGEEETEYVDELEVYFDDIEEARNMIHAMSYLVQNIEAKRPEWADYGEALHFIDENLSEVQLDDEKIIHQLEHDDSPSGLVSLTIEHIDDDGETEKNTFSLYLADISPEIELDVSSSEINLNFETKEGRDFIRISRNGKTVNYTSDLELYMSGVDEARDLKNAFQFAIAESQLDVEEFADVSGVIGWTSDNVARVENEDNVFEQEIQISPDQGNQLVFILKITEEGDDPQNYQYILYPEDISLDDLEVDISRDELTVPLGVDGKDYIKQFESSTLQGFTDEFEVYFSDPLVARNFIEAMKALKEQSIIVDPATMDWNEAMTFLTENIQNLETEDLRIEQTLELLDEESGKFKFILTEDDDGDVTAYEYEFIITDLDPARADISADDHLLEIEMVTKNEQDLIKPYENGEVEDFDNEFSFYADDVLLAKKLRAAFETLAKE